MLLVIFIMRYHILVPKIHPFSLKEFEWLLPSCIHGHFCMCERVCMWHLGVLLYMVFSFKTVDNYISIGFQVNGLLHFMFGGFVWEPRWILCSLRKPASVSPWPKSSSYLRVYLFRANLRLPASPPRLAKWLIWLPGALMWFWHRWTSISTYLQLCQIGIIKSKASNSFNVVTENRYPLSRSPRWQNL